MFLVLVTRAVIVATPHVHELIEQISAEDKSPWASLALVLQPWLPLAVTVIKLN